jgi:hypothetical protein
VPAYIQKYLTSLIGSNFLFPPSNLPGQEYRKSFPQIFELNITYFSRNFHPYFLPDHPWSINRHQTGIILLSLIRIKVKNIDVEIVVAHLDRGEKVNSVGL